MSVNENEFGALSQQPDMLIVGEFDEMKGPSVVKLLPETADSVNAFLIVQRVLSINFSTQTDNEDTDCTNETAVSGMHFESDVSMLWSFEGGEMYVYFITLYDLEARGYTRRVCMCYVTSNSGHLRPKLDLLEDGFSAAAAVTQRSNFVSFLTDLAMALTEPEVDGEALHSTFDTFMSVYERVSEFDEVELTPFRPLHDLYTLSRDKTPKYLKDGLCEIEFDAFRDFRCTRGEFLRELPDLMEAGLFDGQFSDILVSLYMDISTEDDLTLGVWAKIPVDRVRFILEFIGRFTFAKHALYAVLSGRPLWILGKEEHQPYIINLVNALEFLVPFSRETDVILWFEGETVSLENVNQFRLVGCSKLIGTLERYRTLVTVVDVEEETFCGPLYTGNRIESTFGSFRHAPDIYTISSSLQALLQSYLNVASVMKQLTENSDYMSNFDDELDGDSAWTGSLTLSSLPRRERNTNSANWHTVLGGQSRRRTIQERPRTVMDVFPTMTTDKATTTTPIPPALPELTKTTAKLCDEGEISKRRSASIEGINERIMSTRHSTALNTTEASAVFAATTFFTPDATATTAPQSAPSSMNTKKNRRTWFSYFRKTPNSSPPPQTRASTESPPVPDVRDLCRNHMFEVLQVYGNDRVIVDYIVARLR